MEGDLDLIALFFPLDNLLSAQRVLELPGNASKLVTAARTLEAGGDLDDSDTASQHSLGPPNDGPQVANALELRFGQARAHRAGFLLGRDPGCDLVLPPVRGISAFHAIITFDRQRRLVFRDIRIPGNRGGGSAVTYDGQGMVKRRGFTWIIRGCARVQTAIINVHLGPGVGFRLVMPTRDIGSDDYTARVDRFKLGADVIPSDIDIEDQLRLFNRSGDSTVAPSGEQTPGTGPIVLEVTAGKLGHGSFGTVTHVWDVSTGDEFAAKAPLNTQDYDRAAWDREISLLNLTNHAHVVKLVRYDKVPHHRLLLEYAPLGNLWKQRRERRFSDYECAQLLHQCVLGLGHIHSGCSQPLIHRDLSPNNILIQSRDPLHVQLSDFGVSKAVDDDDCAHTVIGTRPYRAPEMLRRQPYGPRVDLWSLGLVVFQMVWPDCPRWSGQYDVDVMEWCDAVAQAARVALRSPRCTALVRLIAEKMLRPDPEERMPAAELCPLAANVVRQFEEPVASPPGQRDGSEGEAEGESDGDGASDGEETTRPLNQATARPARSLAPPPSSNLKRQRSPASNEAPPSAQQWKQPRRLPDSPETFRVWDSNWLNNSMAVGSEVAGLGCETPSGWNDEPSMSLPTTPRRPAAQPVGEGGAQGKQAPRRPRG